MHFTAYVFGRGCTVLAASGRQRWCHRYPSTHDYSGRTDEQFIAHQRTNGHHYDHSSSAGSRLGLAVGAGGNESVLALSRSLSEEFVFFANELPDIPEARKVIEKYLKLGAIGIGEQKFPVDADSNHMQRSRRWPGTTKFQC